MNIRLKKEFQSLFWPWLVTVLIGLLPVLSWILPAGQFEQSFRSVYVLSGVGFVLGVVLLGALPFGEEFNLRTLPLLLSQPITRRQIWQEKFRVAFLLITSVALTYLLSYLPFIGLIKDQLKVIVAFLVFSLCSSTFWTMLARSTIGGAVLCLFSQAIVLIITYFFTRKDYLSTAAWMKREEPETCLLAASLILSPLFLVLGWRMFNSLQSSGNWETETTVSLQQGTDTARPKWLGIRSASPLQNMVLKEFHLYKPVFVIIFLFICLWGLVAGLNALVPRKHDTFSDLLNGFTLIYSPLVLLVSGCISLGEEKGLGLHPYTLVLPVSPRMQWFVKISIASLIGLCGSLLVPILLVKAESMIFAKTVDTGIKALLTEKSILMLFFLLFPLAVSVGFWAATIVNRTIHAAFLAGVTVLSMATFHTLGKNSGPDYALLAIGPVDWLTAHLQLSVGLGGTYTSQIFFLSYICLGLAFPILSWFGYRQQPATAPYLIKVAGLLLTASFVSGFLVQDIRRSGTEQHFQQGLFHREILAAIKEYDADIPRPKDRTLFYLSSQDLVKTGKLSPLTQKWLADSVLKIEQSAVLPHKTARTPSLQIHVSIEREGHAQWCYFFVPMRQQKTTLSPEVN